MAVISNGGLLYYEWQIKGRRIRRPTGLQATPENRALAKRKEPEVKRMVLQEMGVEEGSGGSGKRGMLLSEALERYYQEKWSAGSVGDQLYRRAELAMKRIGDKPVAELTSEDLLRLKQQLRSEGYAKATINRYIVAITAPLRYGWKYWNTPGNMVIPHVPAVPREDEGTNMRVRVIDEREEERILQACAELAKKNPDYADFADLFIVLIDTGMRLGEALKLDYRRHIDFKDGAIYLPGRERKWGQPLGIPMTKRVQKILLRRKLAHPERPFDCFQPYQPLHRLNKAIELAGLPNEGAARIVIHSLRHTFAVRLLRAGASIYAVSALLGHASVATTERYYGHLHTQTLRGAIDALEEYRAKQRQQQNVVLDNVQTI